MINGLSIETVEKPKWGEISQEVNNWVGLALNRAHQAMAEKQEEDLFLSSFSVATNIYDELTCEPFISTKYDWNTVLICRDSLHLIQAVALIEKVSNQIIYLMTHPNNLRHQFNENLAHRVQGAGSAIILHLAQFTLKTGVSVQVKKPLKNAIPFYEKLGFEKEITSETDSNIKGYA